MRSPRRAIVAAFPLLLACATGGSSPPPPPTPAMLAPPPPRPIDEASLVWQPIPFPDGVFVGYVRATAPPSASRSGEAVVVQVPFADRSPVQCTIVRGALDAGGSIEAVMARGPVATRLRDLKVEDVDVSPETGLLSVVARRDDETRVKVAAQRDRSKTLVCVHEGAADLAAFKRVAASLAESLQPGDGPPPSGLVELCSMKVGDGSLGFERVEIAEEAGGPTITRVTSLMAFRDGPTGLDLMELSSDETEVDGRLTNFSTTRLFGGRPDLKATLTRDASGAYRAVVAGRRGQRHDDLLRRVSGAQGLPGSGALRARIKAELIEGTAQEFQVEGFDPLEPDKATLRIFARGAGPGEIVVTDGPRVSRQVVDGDGFMTSAETTLSAGILVTTCGRPPRAP